MAEHIDPERIRYVVREEVKRGVREETRTVIREELPPVVERTLHSLKSQIDRLERKLEELERHITNKRSSH